MKLSALIIITGLGMLVITWIVYLICMLIQAVRKHNSDDIAGTCIVLAATVVVAGLLAWIFGM